MTGEYLRIEREGSWINVEIEHLTDEERLKIANPMVWLNLVCKTLSRADSEIAQLERDKEELQIDLINFIDEKDC